MTKVDELKAKAAAQLLEDYGHVVFGTLTREQLQKELEEVVS